MLLFLCLLSALFVLCSTSNAEDAFIIRLPARVAFTPKHNLLMNHADGMAAIRFNHPAKAHFGLDVTVDIGTPGKPFLLRLFANMLDGDSWLVGNPDFASVVHLYNASESSTSTNLGRDFKAEVFWIEGAVNGSIFSDILKFDLSYGNPLVEVNQSFGVAEVINGSVAVSLYFLFEVDGFLGLAPLVTTPNGVPSLLQTLASTHNITTTTVWIESWSNNSSKPIDPKTVLNASITFGGLDSEHCNSTGWISAKWAVPQQWAINVESMAFSTGERLAVNTKTYFVAGMPVSMLPKEHADFIVKSVNASKFGNEYRVPCNQLTHGPTIELSLNSHPAGSLVKMQLTPKDYIIKIETDLCLLAFIYYPDEVPGPRPWLLGGSIFNRYCVAIDTQEGVVKFSQSLK